MPDLLGRLGYADRAKAKALCPLHDEKTPSFGIAKKGEKWVFHCFGCGEGGDEVAFLSKLRGISAGDAIKAYGELAGVNGYSKLAQTTKAALEIFGGKVELGGGAGLCGSSHGGSSPDTTKKASMVPPVQSLSPLTLTDIKRVSEWRGLAPEFVARLSADGILGKHENCIAFRVGEHLHFRKPGGEGWRWVKPKGAKVGPLVLGDVASGEVAVTESSWDALALHEALPCAVVGTGGASNAKLILQVLPVMDEGVLPRVIAAPQNDEPGMKWLRDLARELKGKAELVVLLTPGKYKDVAEWRKATDAGTLLNAYFDAKPYGEPDNRLGNNSTPALPTISEAAEPPRVRRADISGVAPAADNLPAAPVLVSSEDGAYPSGDAREEHQTKCPRKRGDSRGGGQSLSETLDGIVSFLRRYVIFPMPEQAEVVALWIAHTYVFKSFRWTPYLHILAPGRECGKTTVLSCLKLLSRKAWNVVAPTPAALYTKIEEQAPTCLIDEAHKIFDGKAQSERNQTLQSILEAGFEQGLTVPRCPNGKLVESDIFSPKAVAGISGLPDTIESRSIQIRLERCSPDAEIGDIDDEEAIEESEPLKDQLERWSASCNLKGLKPVRQPWKSRQRNIAKPLLVIAEQAGEEWAERARRSIGAMFSKEDEMSQSEALLSAIRAVFNNKGRNALSTIELLDALISTETAGAVWVGWWERDFKNGQTHKPAQKLAEMLKPYEITSKPVEVDQEEVAGYYREDFADAWARYLPPLTMDTKELPF